MGGSQSGHPLHGGGEGHPVAGQGRSYSDGNAKVRLARARWPQEDGVGLGLDEVQGPRWATTSERTLRW